MRNVGIKVQKEVVRLIEQVFVLVAIKQVGIAKVVKGGRRSRYEDRR